MSAREDTEVLWTTIRDALGAEPYEVFVIDELLPAFAALKNRYERAIHLIAGEWGYDAEGAAAWLADDDPYGIYGPEWLGTAASFDKSGDPV